MPRTHSPSAALQPRPAAAKPNRAAPGLFGTPLSTRAAPPAAGLIHHVTRRPRPHPHAVTGSAPSSWDSKLLILGPQGAAGAIPEEANGLSDLSRDPRGSSAPGRSAVAYYIHRKGPAGSGTWK